MLEHFTSVGYKPLNENMKISHPTRHMFPKHTLNKLPIPMLT